MSEHKIQPAAITKPMQLLAAWLVGLLAIDTCFLLAASRFPAGSMESSALAWAAIVNVPLFLAALFLLQTKFRPELQEDLYYSTYINQKTNQPVSVSRDEQRLTTVLGRIERVENLLQLASSEILTRDDKNLLHGVTFGINQNFSDREELSAKLLGMGVPRHTWFGSDELPKERVISVSEHLTKETQQAVLVLAEKLGFTKYNLFDGFMEEIEEDVLIGSYGFGDRKIPRTAA
jgi:hypothetical protein